MSPIDPNPGGTEFSDNLWMVGIQGVGKDIDLLQYLNLSEYIAADNISIEVSVDDDTEGAQKYDFMDRENVI